MTNNVIEVKNLNKQYLKQKVLSDVSVQIERGKIYGLIGPNGAGKTTLMKVLGGLVLPTEGEVSIYGATDEKGLAKARSRMSFIIETPYANESMSARENLEKQRLQIGIPDKNRVEEVLNQVGLSDAGKKPVKKFSLGMRQRLGIANALLKKPEIMVLDEPVNGLDPEGIVEIREFLLKLNKEEKMTIIISSHILSELSLLCTDYIFLHHGKIMQTIDAKGLKKLCREHYHIHTDQDALALAILQKKLGVTEYSIEEDGSICLYEKLESLREVSKALYEGGVIPLELVVKEANLEKYYMDMVGEKDVESDKSAKFSE